MGKAVNFHDRVVVVTGAGNGLGRMHAKLFASRGAKVLVNDLGGGSAGGGQSQAAADKVVAEITEAGGVAVANYDSVVDGKKIIQQAVDTWGRVDVVVNNAGVLRDRSFQKLTDEDWKIVFLVHMYGAFQVTHAAWPYFREQQYGRVIMTTSAAGIYGNFGQSNYSAAKLGLLGLANTLALEGAKRNIHVNTIAPLAASRLTEGIIPDEDLFAALKPELVSPLVAYLCHESCQENGGLFEVGGGFYAKLRWERAKGKTFRIGRDISPELIKSAWKSIAGFEETTHPANIALSMGPIVDNVAAGPSKGANQYIDVDVALSQKLPDFQSEHSKRDVSLYALGVGAGKDPLDTNELQLVYESHGRGFRVMPTFGVALVVGEILRVAAKTGKLAPGLNFGLERLLHGEQYTEVFYPLRPEAKLTHKSRVSNIYDKGKGATVVIETCSYDEAGLEIFRNHMTAFIRGAGGFGGERGSSGPSNVPPERSPDHITKQETSSSQALLYRLSGDWNPLHVDPAFAKAFGFQQPILHGLCTYGYAARHVINAFAGGDPRLFKSIKARFAESVLPGETLVTEMWKESDTKIIFRCKVEERDALVITQAAVELHPEIPVRPKKQVEAASEAPKAEPTISVADVFSVVADYVTANPSMVDSVKKIFQFQITNPDSIWTLDLVAGSVSEGESAPPHCTLQLSQENFIAMASGKADPMKMFMQGDLQISGDLMASQKLNFFKKLDPSLIRPGAASNKVAKNSTVESTATETTVREPSAATIFTALETKLKAQSDFQKEANIQFIVTSPDSQWNVDLRPDGKVREGVHDADLTITISDESLEKLSQGAAPKDLFQRGQFESRGDLRLARMLTFLQRSQS